MPSRSVPPATGAVALSDRAVDRPLGVVEPSSRRERLVTTGSGVTLTTGSGVTLLCAPRVLHVVSLVAEIELTGEHVPLVDLAVGFPSLTFTIEDGHTNDSGPSVLFLGVRGDDFAELEGTLAGAETVESMATITERDGERLYQIIYQTDDEFDLDLDRLALREAMVDSIRVTETGLLVRARFSSREELIAVRETVVEHDISFRLIRLTETDRERDRDGLDRLTDRQRDALLTAHEMGYFEVPRRASLQDVAGTLGITAPSLSERLRRAQSRLVEHYADGNLIKPLID